MNRQNIINLHLYLSRFTLGISYIFISPLIGICLTPTDSVIFFYIYTFGSWFSRKNKSKMASRSKKIEVLLVGTGVDGNYEKLIERAGGDNINLKVVKTVDHVIMEHLLLLASYDLIILMVTVDNGIKV